MSTEIEVIVSWMADFVVNDRSWKIKYMVMKISRLVPKLKPVWNYIHGLPGGTLSGDPGWKNLVW